MIYTQRTSRRELTHRYSLKDVVYYFFPVGRHCEARSAVAIHKDLPGLPRFR